MRPIIAAFAAGVLLAGCVSSGASQARPRTMWLPKPPSRRRFETIASGEPPFPCEDFLTSSNVGEPAVVRTSSR